MNPSGAGLQVPFSRSFLLRQSPRWCTNLQHLCASLLTSSFPFSFPFAVVCPEKEVEFQRAPNGEPCLPTHLPTPCCLHPPASHATPFCHVRVLHSSSLHVCAVWVRAACPARRGPWPKVSQWPDRWASECTVWHPPTPRRCRAWTASSSPGQDVKLAGTGGSPRERPSHAVAQEERPCSLGTSHRLAASGHVCGGQKSWSTVGSQPRASLSGPVPLSECP